MARKPTRGRPQGSGINDAKTLEKISKLLTKNPDMKPTTAIKAAGINDPSSIRRLRDKLKSASPAKKTTKPNRTVSKKTVAKKTVAKKAAATSRRAPARKKKPVAKTATTRKAPAKKARPKNKATARKTVTTRTATASSRGNEKAAPRKTVHTRKAPGKSPASPLSAMADFGFKNPFSDMANGMSLPTEIPGLDMDNLISSTVEKQIQFYESALKFSPMANLLRQQAMLTDMMLTMLRTQKELTKPSKSKP